MDFKQTKRSMGEKQVSCLSVCLGLCNAVRPQNPTRHMHNQCAEKCTSCVSRNLQFQNSSEPETLFLTEVYQQRFISRGKLLYDC